jgi:hypothetical protein
VDAGRLIRFDVSRPWYSTVAALGSVAAAPDPRAELSRRAAEQGVTTGSGLPIEFVAEDDAPAGRAYEVHIATTGRVPTRLNPHDLFNALVWLALPCTKGRLNALQAAAVERDGVRACRGPLRDAATVFDENGALLVTANLELPALLREHRWRAAFVERRIAWSAVRVLCLGHALMEKLGAPYKAITAHALVIERPPDAPLNELDLMVSRRIDEGFRTTALLPLPVLGVPGWCVGNANPTYYDDTSVFRPMRGAAAGVSRR